MVRGGVDLVVDCTKYLAHIAAQDSSSFEVTVTLAKPGLGISHFNDLKRLDSLNLKDPLLNGEGRSSHSS